MLEFCCFAVQSDPGDFFFYIMWNSSFCVLYYRLFLRGNVEFVSFFSVSIEVEVEMVEIGGLANVLHEQNELSEQF